MALLNLFEREILNDVQKLNDKTLLALKRQNINVITLRFVRIGSYILVGDAGKFTHRDIYEKRGNWDDISDAGALFFYREQKDKPFSCWVLGLSTVFIGQLKMEDLNTNRPATLSQIEPIFKQANIEIKHERLPEKYLRLSR